MDILRFTTAGSVDDGKSTLIGRLLHDTGNIKQDILQSLRETKQSKGQSDDINFAHLTDGLRAEREGGITIDVAYKYFATKDRKYIITDAPGHFQYTGNLVTGASNVDVMIILVDAQNGITSQTKRHSMVASFLGIRHIVVAVNKMDAIGHSEQVFTTIKNDYEKATQKLNLPELIFIPISALNGDNVTIPSTQMGWYAGPTLLQYLELCKSSILQNGYARFTVQYVISSAKVGFEKGFAGMVLSGGFKAGDCVCLYPGRHFAIIGTILNGYSEVKQCDAGQNVSLYLVNDPALARGSMVSHCYQVPKFTKQFEAVICWLDNEGDLKIDKRYILRINAMETECKIKIIDYVVDNDTFDRNFGNTVKVNEFAKVTIETFEEIAFDSFSQLPQTGRGIIIDIQTNNTSGAFIIL